MYSGMPNSTYLINKHKHILNLSRDKEILLSCMPLINHGPHTAGGKSHVNLGIYCWVQLDNIPGTWKCGSHE